jgi:hypothetical protein
MARQRAQALPAEVQVVRGRIDHWRQTRANGDAMPAGLWAEAVRLARRHGVYAIARALSVHYGALRQRVAAPPAPPPDAAGGFVELRGAQFLGATAAAGPVVEVDDGAGARLTIRLAADAALDVAGVVAGFCRRRA